MDDDENDQLIFPTNMKQNLGDKNLEKVMQATKDIQQIIEKNVKIQHEQKILRIINYVIGEYVNQNTYNLKRGGLKALVSIAIGLQSNADYTKQFIEHITKPIIKVLSDPDAKIRYQGLEQLYYICKVLRIAVLKSFNNIFEGVVHTISDVDEEVRKAAQQVDIILKDIVCEALPDKNQIQLENFMPVLVEKLKAQNPNIRNMLINWIITLDQIPNIDILKYIPQLVEPLFLMLSDQNKEIQKNVDNCLQEFLKEIQEKMSPGNFQSEKQDSDQLSTKNNFDILELLVTICSNPKFDHQAKFKAIEWIQTYLKILITDFESQLSSSQQLPFNPTFKSPVSKATVAKSSKILETTLNLISNEEEVIRQAAEITNELLLKILQYLTEDQIDLKDIMPILKDMLTSKRSKTAECALSWMRRLLQTYPKKMFPTIESILQKLLEKLHNSDGSIVQDVMDVLVNISGNEQYFQLVIINIINICFSHREILDNKIEIILQKLCQSLGSKKVFMLFAQKLKQCEFDDAVFFSSFVKNLDLILQTDPQLADLRNTLKNIQFGEQKKENLEIFEQIFTTWCYNPIHTITLCFLCQAYELAYKIIMSFAEVQIEVDTLVQIARLINLLESPNFVYLRLQLLEHQKYPFLLKSLYGLMMILPQGKAYNALKQRLKIADHIHETNIEQNSSQISEENKIVNVIDVKHMLNIYYQAQERIRISDKGIPKNKKSTNLKNNEY